MPEPRKPGVQPSRTGGPGPSIPAVKWGRDVLVRKTRRITEAIRAYIAEFTYLIIRDRGTVPDYFVRMSVDGTILYIEGMSAAGAVGQVAAINIEGGLRSVLESLFLPRDIVEQLYLGEKTSGEKWLRITRDGVQDYTLEQKISTAWVALENITDSQGKVDTHAADTSTHGAAEVADVATVSAEIDSDISTHAALSASHGRTNLDGVTERDAAIATHAADTSTHGVSEVADDAGKGARVYRDSNQSIPDSTWTAITSYNQEQYDTDTIHDVATNPSRLTCKTAGKYTISGHIVFDTDLSSGSKHVAIKLNGSTIIAKQGIETITEQAEFSISTPYALSVNDYVELVVYQNSGGALNVMYQSAYSPYFAMQRISG